MKYREREKLFIGWEPIKHMNIERKDKPICQQNVYHNFKFNSEYLNKINLSNVKKKRKKQSHNHDIIFKVLKIKPGM